MGASYYPEFQPPIEPLPAELRVDGKAIARAMPLLEAWATELDVRSLMSFYSESNAEAFEKIGESLPDDMEDSPIEWSEPADALRSVRAYLDHLRDLGGKQLSVADNEGEMHTVSAQRLVEDLRAIERELVHAAGLGARFRLRIDV
jgi:hypothetical protein